MNFADTIKSSPLRLGLKPACSPINGATAGTSGNLASPERRALSLHSRRAAAIQRGECGARLLRRVGLRQNVEQPEGLACETALVVDIETTGTDVDSCEVIQIVLLLLSYDRDGNVYGIGQAITCQQTPTVPLSDEVVALVGIRNEELEHCSIDPEFLDIMVGAADIIVAHDAEFVQPVVERVWPVFRERPWGCSRTQIPWDHEGVAITSLDGIAPAVGLFIPEDDHHADCRTVAEVLAATLPKSGEPVLRALLDAIESAGH